jgi:ADP-heptose:LPS heptosyltransferase
MQTLWPESRTCRQTEEGIQLLKAERPLTASNAGRVCEWIAARLESDPSVWDRAFVREAVDLLCEAATHPQFGQIGQQAIFTLVERFSDSFEPTYVPVYDEVFAQTIDFCRRLPAGAELHRTLQRFGIHNEEDLLARKKSVVSSLAFPRSQHGSVRKILVLSRVTLGADVAVTSVVAGCLLQAFPNAEILLAGPASLRQIYENGARLRTVRVDYRKGASLMDRLRSWIDLVRVIDGECNGLARGEYLIVDPDSRLTQLGLLPVTEDDSHYFFFESRSYQRAGSSHLSKLAAQWCREKFACESGGMPFVRLSAEDREFGSQCCRGLRTPNGAGVVAVNFGAGENERKRLSLEFEAQLVLEMLGQGRVVILDKGIGDEVARADRIVNSARTAGKHVLELHDAQRALSASGSSFAELVTWQGGVGGFAGLIASSDLYAGYDSAFQHIAAALSVPVIDIFVQPQPGIFIDRWTPCSEAPVTVIQPGSTATASSRKSTSIVSETVSLIASLTAANAGATNE